MADNAAPDEWTHGAADAPPDHTHQKLSMNSVILLLLEQHLFLVQLLLLTEKQLWLLLVALGRARQGCDICTDLWGPYLFVRLQRQCALACQRSLDLSCVSFFFCL